MRIIQKISLLVRVSALLLKLYIAKFFSIFYNNDEIWLISERGREARDNGYFFFLYMKREHPEIKTKYILDFNSPDYDKVSLFREDLVQYRSWEHYIMIWRAKYLISTHICGWSPNHNLVTVLDHRLNIFKNKKKIFLQHGITQNYLPYVFGTNVNLDVFVAGAKTEYEYLCENFKYKPGIIQYTGFCRYDNLNQYETKRQILIMPTWRSYINKERFEDCEYYKQYASLLKNPIFHDLLNKYNYSAVFYPHYEIQPLIESFKKLNIPTSISIAGFDYDVQTLLKESDMLITDYSSVYFDIGYMHKPILFFQFDQKEFYSKHYQKGYFNCNDIGDIVTDINTLLRCLESLLQKDCKMEKKYEDFALSFFVIRDSHNCDRVYNAILKL